MDWLEIFAKVFEFRSLTQERLLNTCSWQFCLWRRVLATCLPIQIFLVIYQTFEIAWILVGQGIAGAWQATVVLGHLIGLLVQSSLEGHLRLILALTAYLVCSARRHDLNLTVHLHIPILKLHS